MARSNDTKSGSIRWFTNARFGMFIHWGVYSLLGRGEWARYTESIPPDEYHSLAQAFKPRYEAAQPGILINNRSGLPGDFRTPEQSIPQGNQEGVFEACVTITHNHWGYCPSDRYKETWHLLNELVACVAAGGNYLLNVGPDADGVIPLPACERLLEIGQWMQTHGEAIYGAERNLPAWWDYCSGGRITTRGNTAYLILQTWSPTGSLSLNQLKNKVQRATLLASGHELQVRRNGRRLCIEGLPALPPAALFNVVKLELDGPAEPHYYY